MNPGKYCIVLLLGWGTCAGPISAADPGRVNDMETLTALVSALAETGYDASARRVPEFLTRLGYDEYRDLQYKEDLAQWHGEGLPFELTFFHSGYIYPKSVALYNIADDDSVAPIVFSPELFDYGPQAHLVDQLTEQVDFSGFHVWHRDQENRLSRVGLFQGASYFRMVSSSSEYGLSGRTVAINTSNPEPEEFPDFSTFWFRQPAPGDQNLIFYGLLESPSLVGGYRFTLTPGTPVRLHVEGSLILRQPVAELGLAPFSSMFWYGENSARRPADFRPEVHDSDGLLVSNSTGSIWRPLANPPATRTDSLPGDDLDMFALLQRDRNYENYQDIEARYHQRPDAWVVPGSNMSAGELRLLEIESPHEYADNIALVWVPSATPEPGSVFEYDYDVYFGEWADNALAQVVATRYGDSLRADGSIEFVIDFDGGPLATMDTDTELEITSEIEGGEFIWQNIRKNPYNTTWRLNLRVAPDDDPNGVHLRARLQHQDEVLSETWQYWWQ